MRPARTRLTPSLARREALARGDRRALARLAEALRSTTGRAAGAQVGPPPLVVMGDGDGAGPRVGYAPAGEACRLVLSWEPAAEAAAVRGGLPDGMDPTGRFRLGPLDDAVPGVVLWVAYEDGRLPAEHQLANDLHAMVMMHDLLRELAGSPVDAG